MAVERQRLIGFLPWLKLKETVSIGKVRFVPFAVGHAAYEPTISSLAGPLTTILSSYVDTQGRPVQGCTVILVTDRNPPWNLRDEDFPEVQWATSLLFLTASVANEYFRDAPTYVNRSMFELYLQRFTQPVKYVALTVRKRDGQFLAAGYKHGQVKFTVPLQSDCRDPVTVDGPFVEGINRALVGSSPSMRRLRPALSFFSLANTDSYMVGEEAEVIMIAAAFEHFFDTHGAYELSKKFGELFRGYGNVKVSQARVARPGIQIDPNYATAQEGWFVHQKWMEELYHLRNAYMHGSDLSARTWGWLPLEHLVMGAFVFPLTVKIALCSEGFYAQTEADEARCLSVDMLLAKNAWPAEEDSGFSVWQKTFLDARWEVTSRAAMRLLNQQPPSDG